jgi:hypothetical protein
MNFFEIATIFKKRKGKLIIDKNSLKWIELNEVTESLAIPLKQIEKQLVGSLSS